MAHYTESDLKELVISNIEDMQHDPILCSQYANICALATDENYKLQLAEQVTNLITKQGIDNIYTALSHIEYQLLTGE
jgi:hypothetical protein